MFVQTKRNIMSILRLKEVIEQKGMTKKELSEKIKVSYNYTTELARGVKIPRIELLIEIATALDVDIRDLFNPTKPTTQKTPKEVLRDAIDNLEVVYTEIDK